MAADFFEITRGTAADPGIRAPYNRLDPVKGDAMIGIERMKKPG